MAATVAITRARALCLIMGPLDMKGLLGAATVMGTLMYGAGHVWAGHAHFYLHDHELSRSPPDEAFIDMLKQNCCLSGGGSVPYKICSSSGRARKYFLRPPVRKPTLVWARITV